MTDLEKNVVKGGSSFSFRLLKESDIPAFSDYWFGDGQREFHETRGMDYSKLGDRDNYERFLRSRVGKVGDQALTLIIDKDGDPIGNVVVNRLQDDGMPRMYLHVWKQDLRNDSVFTVLFPTAVNHVMAVLELDLLYLEPSSANIAMNEFIQRFGLDPVKTYTIKDNKLLKDMEVNRYEISRERAAELLDQ